MKKNSFEMLNDWFVNLYKEWIFIRCFEYSAILLWKITWYRLYTNIDRKSWFIFLELWFPETKLNEVLIKLENSWYRIRLIEKNWNITEIVWVNCIYKDNTELINLKTNLINF
jgi:hypothetical protein